jgi:formylglycine-generating enzyme required for sulfatase activity
MMTIYRKYTPTEIEGMAENLKEQGSDGILAEGTLESFKFRGTEGNTWTVLPETGEWYCWKSGSWQPVQAPESALDGSVELLDLVTLPITQLEEDKSGDPEPAQPEADIRQMIERATGRIREAYTSGRINSAGAENLLKDLYLLDPGGLIWSLGMHSGEWYFFRRDDWERADDEGPNPLDFQIESDAPQNCSHCGTPLKGGKFCSECGTPAPGLESRYTEAAREVVEGFTESDAAPLPEPIVPDWKPAPGFPGPSGVDATASEDPQPASPQAPRKRRRNVILLSLLVFVVTCLCCLTLGLGGYFFSEDEIFTRRSGDGSIPDGALDQPQGGISADNPSSPGNPTPTALLSEIRDPSGQPMVLVAAGEFEMGGEADFALAECQKLLEPDLCDRDRHVIAEPIHSVYLDDFYLDKYEVSNAQYAYFLNEQGNQTEAGAAWLDVDSDEALILESSGSWQPKDGYANHPVVQITWYGARAYCQWRGARLPTEAEWEKAARGVDGRFYPWGNSFDGERLNFCDSNCTLDWAYSGSDDGYIRTAPVGTYSAGVSPYGVYNMVGNVSEWVEDWLEVYPGGDPESSENYGQQYRVIRGGSWSTTGAVGTIYRITGEPAQAPFATGFRCALSP